MTRGLAVDIGGTHIRLGLVDQAGVVHRIAKQRLHSVATGCRTQDIWNGILSAIVDCECAYRDALAPGLPVVISFPGPITSNRFIVQAPTLVGDEATMPDIAQIIEDRTGRPVYLLNDISAAAWYLSSVVEADRFLVLTVSSGIGSKIFDRRHPLGVLDEPVYAGEIGHFVVGEGAGAPACDCGGIGHLGAVASGRAIERRARAQAAVDPQGFRNSLLAGTGKSTDTITNEEHIVPAAIAGDEWSLEVIRRSTLPLSRTLCAVFLAAGLQRIFVIGGFAEALGDTYLRILREQMYALSQYAVAKGCIESIVEPGSGQGEACLLGCGTFLKNRGLLG